MNLKNTALLFIDFQQGFDDWDIWGGERNNSLMEQNAKALLDYFRSNKALVVHAQHCSINPNSLLHPGQKGNEFTPALSPIENEAVFQKNVNSAFIGTNLEPYLKDKGISKLVVAGLTTDHCVSTSVRMAGNLGFEVVLVEDACATFPKVAPNGKTYDAEEIHQTALASLNDEFARVLSLKQFLD